MSDLIEQMKSALEKLKSKTYIDSVVVNYSDQQKIIKYTENLEQKLAKALEILKYYAKHDHHLNTTAPNFAREALKEIGEA